MKQKIAQNKIYENLIITKFDGVASANTSNPLEHIIALAAKDVYYAWIIIVPGLTNALAFTIGNCSLIYYFMAIWP